MTDFSGPVCHDRVTTVSRRSWAIEVGRLRVGMTRMREEQTSAGPTAYPAGWARSRSAWPMAAGTFLGVSTFGLIAFGALATPRAPGSVSYVLSVPVPIVQERAVRRPLGKATATRPARRPKPMPAADSIFEAGDEPHVAAALQTGELQEWRDARGQARFLTVGPASVATGETCREVALLIRRFDGSNDVRSVRRCIAEDPQTGKAVSPGNGTNATDEGET